MDYTQDLINKFRKKFGMVMPDRIRHISDDEMDRHSKFLHEEFVTELGEAQRLKDETERYVEIADAMADGLVFMQHCLCHMGMQNIFHEIYAEVNSSNLTKGDEDGNLFAHDGKMIKGPNFHKPDLRPWFSGAILLSIQNEEALCGIEDFASEIGGQVEGCSYGVRIETPHPEFYSFMVPFRGRYHSQEGGISDLNLLPCLKDSYKGAEINTGRLLFKGGNHIISKESLLIRWNKK